MRISAINLILALLLAFAALPATSADKVPDFNYPQTVIENADKSLDAALKKDNHADVVKFLIQGTIAEAQISSDYIPEILNKIDSVAAIETDSAAIATMRYLKAVVYSSYFSNNSYAISQRKPSGDTADDISEWTKADFLDAVTGNLSQAFKYKDALWNTPIGKYIEADELSATIYPTMLDMIAYRGAMLINQIIEYRPANDAAFTSDAAKRAKEFMNDAVTELAKRHEGDAAPHITAVLWLTNADDNYEKTGTVAKSLYEKYGDNEFCYLALEPYLNTIDNDKLKYDLLNDYVSKFPRSPFAPDARNRIAQLAHKSVNLTYSSTFTSTDSVEIDIAANNVNSCRILVYRVPDGSTVNSKLLNNRSRLQLVAKATARLQGEVPFSDTVKVTLKPLTYGRYIVLPDYDNILSEKSIYPQEFRVSDITLFQTKSSGGVKVFAVNSVTGKPMEGVYINRVDKNDLAQTGHIAANRTNADGYCLIKNDDKRLQERVAAVKGNDRYGMATYVSEFALYEAEPEHIEVLTDLGVYHPGDTVRYSAICYHIDRNSKNTTANLPVEVSFFDANYKEIATDSLVTDEYGRVNGAFVIPSDRMNGNWGIDVNSDNASGVVYFPVSEYKTPTFFVEFDEASQSYARNADVTITGHAAYFTGMPVANARVNLNLGYQRWNWWYRYAVNNSTFIKDFKVATDDEGHFTITIPQDILNDKELPSRLQFSLEASVTDDAGETQSATRLFWLGNTRVIEFTDGNYTFEVSAGSISMPIAVRSSNPADTLLTCDYVMSGKGTSGGSFTAARPSIDFSSLPSGEYKLKVTIDGDTITEPLETEIVIFRDTDTSSPVESPLWIPECRVDVSSDNVASLLLGNSDDNTYIYCIAASKKGVVKETWLQYGKGLHRFTIDVPKAEDEYIDLTFITVRDNRSYTWNRRLESKMHRDTLHIMPEAFRDNLVPGTPETWTFKLVNQSGQLRRGAMLCDMYDKALDMIANHSWEFYPQSGYSMIYGYRTLYVFPAGVYSSLSYHLEETKDIGLPDLDFYGRNYAGRIYVRGRSYSSTMAKASAGSVNGIMVAEEIASTDESMAAPEAELQEVMVVETDNGAAQSQLENVQMRTADIQNALWRPNLTSDTCGNVSITFNTPQFNTTWLFKAIAYTQDLHTASFVKEVVTKKPIMVRAALPRFVRNGDLVTLSSMLMNATDSTQNCTAVVELFDYETGKVVLSRDFSETLGGKASKALDIEWEVPADISAIGYRVKAATSEFGDGEQHLLTILPSISPVIETIPFYLYGNNTFDLSIDDKEQLSGRVTLEFCNNPTWYCVTALPSIMQDDYLTATGLSHSLYAIAVAQGVANSNPDIKRSVDYWLANECDSTLVSNLAKNNDLKIGSLQASPWINEADRQTLRMQQIGLLFDSTAVATETSKLINKLRNLQLNDGGWTWYRYNGCSSSQYVTLQVLQLIGELQHLGYMTDNIDINAMSQKAVAYIDRCAAEDYDRMKDKQDLSSFYNYAYVRSLFPSIKFTSSAHDVLDNVLDRMKSQWDKATGLGDKAWCAMTLYRNGEKKTARKIMESVRQYSIENTNGIYWDNFKNGSDRAAGRVAVTSTLLQAFGEICTDDRETIDGIRQWMLLQKQSTDWGNCSLAADAVYSILSTGTEWLDSIPVPAIMLNGKPLEYGTTDLSLGYFRKQIEADGDKLALSIYRRGAASPTWGAVYCQYSAEMDGTKAVQTDDMSIEKQICKLDGGVLDSNASLAVGDKVVVRLVIKNSRDLQFVTVNDERAACCEPADQLSGYRYDDGTGYYLETKDSSTRLFFNYLPKGTHIATYEVSITSPGRYNLGIATIQSQYAPQLTAHSAGSTIVVK